MLKNKIKINFEKVFFVVFCLIIVLFSTKGIHGNIKEDELFSVKSRVDNPFELSPEKGRFTLLYSVIENDSVELSLPLARFTTPDLGYVDGKYVSLFPPAVSFLAIPGYLFGKMFNVSQYGAFAVVGVFAVLNALIIRGISSHLGTSSNASAVGALSFLFATPAYAYSTTLYQHHITAFAILFSIYLLIKYETSLLAHSVVWVLIASSIVIDSPSIIFMFPIALLAVSKIIKVESKNKTLKVKFNLSKTLMAILASLIPLVMFFIYNHEAYGNPLQLSGTVSSVDLINDQGLPESFDKGLDANEIEQETKTSIGFFDTQNMINGLYVHLFSLDRGVIFYSTIVLFGVYGLVELSRKNSQISSLLVSIVSLNLIIYSMWGDPWGGWAFGSRYLIPSYAIFAISLPFTLDVIKRKGSLLILFFFFIVLSYGVIVNSLGALTSNLNPPKVEAAHLSTLSGKMEKYTFERNYDYLMSSGSKSYVYNTYLKDHIKPLEFYLVISAIIILTCFGYLYGLAIYESKRKLGLNNLQKFFLRKVI